TVATKITFPAQLVYNQLRVNQIILAGPLPGAWLPNENLTLDGKINASFSFGIRLGKDQHQYHSYHDFAGLTPIETTSQPSVMIYSLALNKMFRPLPESGLIPSIQLSSINRRKNYSLVLHSSEDHDLNEVQIKRRGNPLGVIPRMICSQ
ncbi:MAG: hypothetical protein EZS28_047020, partial [Streblomastix strix]